MQRYRFRSFEMKNNVTIVLCCFIGFIATSYQVRQEECLNPSCTYILGYEPDLENKEIIFDVTVKTTGYVGFGVAPKAGMDNADIVIGGLRNNEAYFQDYHGTGKMTPTLDESQDWKLLEGRENATHTMLKFKRLFDTCDTVGDMVISADTINVIWSFGDTDDIRQHSPMNRGGRQFLLLDPPPPFTNLSQFETYEIRVTNTVPSVKTSYLCSFHKFPKFENQKYLVGVEAFVKTENAVRYTHHFTVTTCRMDNVDKLEQLVQTTATQSKNCFGELLVMRNFCNEVLFGWAVGGKRVMLPDHVGVPFGDSSSQNDPEGSLYVMLEVHYENPAEEDNIKYTTGFDVFYTDVKRKYDGSIIMVGHEVNPALLIPPKSLSHIVAGHCSSEITQALLPPEGVNIISVNMHSHIAGRQIRVRHYRDKVELPWILNDPHYDFDFQQTRELRKEVKLLPGDHLINECVFETMDRHVVTLGGESTYSEMCHSFLVYYPRIQLRACKSHYPIGELWSLFGIEKVQMTPSNMFDPTVIAPESMNGKLFSEVLNEMEWTKELREKVQQDLRYGHHLTTFTAGNYGGESNSLLVNNFGMPRSYGLENTTIPKFTVYPDTEDYQPAKTSCNNTQSEDEHNNTSNFISISKIILIAVMISLSLVYV